jgi:hypothetical protein
LHADAITSAKYAELHNQGAAVLAPLDAFGFFLVTFGWKSDPNVCVSWIVVDPPCLPFRRRPVLHVKAQFGGESEIKERCATAQERAPLLLLCSRCWGKNLLGPL